MNINSSRNSLLRARNIRNAKRSRRYNILSGKSGSTSSRNVYSKNSISSLGSTSSSVNAKKISMYESLEKSAKNLQSNVDNMLTIGKMTYTDDKDGEEAKKNSYKSLISGIENFVYEYNNVYSVLGDSSDATNPLFKKQISDIVSSNESGLQEIGVSVSKNGELTIDEAKLNSADFDKLKKIFAAENGFADKMSRKMEVIESTAANSILMLNKLYGANSTYNKYGTGNLYGNSYYNNYGNYNNWYF